MYKCKRYFLNYFIKDLNYIKYFDYCSSNEDVKKKKPNPEQYLLTMAHFGISPLNTFIFEDSNHGLMLQLILVLTIIL